MVQGRICLPTASGVALAVRDISTTRLLLAQAEQVELSLVSSTIWGFSVAVLEGKAMLCETQAGIIRS